MRKSDTVLIGVLVALFASAAHAVDRHETIRVSPFRRGGKPGFRLSLTIRPTGTYPRVRVGLGMFTTKQLDPNGDVLRLMAGGEKPGYLVAKLPELTIEKEVPKLFEHELLYGEGEAKDLAPGMKVEVVTAFTGNDNYSLTVENVKYPYFHVYGMQYGPMHSGDTENVIELPAPQEK